MNRALGSHFVVSCIVAGLLAVTALAGSNEASIPVTDASAALAQLPAGPSIGCNPVRAVVRNGTEINAGLVHTTQPFASQMDTFIRETRPTYLPDDFRLNFERALHSLQDVHVFSFKMTRYGDLELLLGDSPTPADAATILAINPSPQCIPPQSPFYAPSKTARGALLAELGRGRSSIPVGQWLPSPPPKRPTCYSYWQLQGLGYFSPRPLEPHSAPNGAEMLPIISAKYQPVCLQPVTFTPSQLSANASLSSARPRKSSPVTVYATVNLDKQPVEGAYLSARWHFKSGVVRCTAQTDATGRGQCSESLQNAAAGVLVHVDVYIYLDLDLPNQSYHRTLTFVPSG